MTVLEWDSLLKTTEIPVKAAVTIGNFDGIHNGHQMLLKRILQDNNLSPVVVTFRENPRRLLKPDLFPGDLITNRQKLALLNEWGVEKVVLIDFSSQFSKLSGRKFLELLVKKLSMKTLVLGDNFRCGYHGDTSAYNAREFLESCGAETNIISPLAFEGSVISSTRIRAAVREGDFSRAERMMGRVFSLDLADTPKKIHEKTINIDKTLISQVLPPPGTYVVDVRGENDHSVRTKMRMDGRVLSIDMEDSNSFVLKNIIFV